MDSIGKLNTFINTYSEKVTETNHKEVIDNFDKNKQDWKEKIIGYFFNKENGAEEYGKALIIYSVAVWEIKDLNQKIIENLLLEIKEYEDNENTKYFFHIKYPLYLNLGLCWNKLGEIYNTRAIEAFKKYIYYLLAGTNNTRYGGLTCYAFRSCSKHLFSSLINEKLNLSSPKTFNDIFDPPIFLLIKKYGDTTAQLIRKAYEDSIKMACFLKNYKLPDGIKKKNKRDKKEFLNELMWSHYADSHRGICIKYNLPSDITSGINDGKEYLSYFKDIQYLSSLKDLSKSDVINMYDAFFAKGKAWKYENELRLLYCNPYNSDIYTSMEIPNCIEAIYFGVQCSDNDKETIMRVLSGKKCKSYTWKRINDKDEKIVTEKPIQFYQMEIDEKKFGELKAMKIK